MVSFMLSALFSLINIGSTEALNAIASLAISSLVTSYFVVVASILHRRVTGGKLPPRRWSLGRWGVVTNVAALIFLFVMLMFTFFPQFKNPNIQNFNWAIVLYVGVLSIAMVFYAVRGRHVYIPPIAITKREFQQ